MLQDREYVRLDQKRFIPAERGRIVVAFLANFFRRYMEYDFTADLEEQLDDISGGRLQWKNVLSAFWTDFHALIEETKELRITEVINVMDDVLGPHFFPTQKGRRNAHRLRPSRLSILWRGPVVAEVW